MFPRPRMAAALTALTLALTLPTTANAADTWTRWVGSPIEATIRSLDFIGPVLYGAGESEGVYTSPATVGPWTTQNNGLDDPTKKQVRQVVANGADLYACTSAGLFKSSGGSGAWTQVGVDDTTRRLDQGGVQSIVFNSPTDMVVAIAGASPSGVMYSSDGGAHWDKATGFPSNESVFYLTRSTAGIIYAAADDGVFTSVNQGRSWTLTSDGIPSSEGARRIAIDAASPNHLYASTSSSVYRSYDGGVTWTEAAGGLAPSGAKDAFILAPTLGGQFGPKHAIVGTQSGAWATVDDGDTWGQMSPDATGTPGEFGNRIVASLGLGFSPPSLMAGTRGFGIYWLPLNPVTAPGSIAVSPSTQLPAGATLSVPGTGWGGSLPFFFTYQWKKCTGSGCTPSQDIPGAVGPTYVVPPADAGTFTRYAVQVCAINVVSPIKVCKLSGFTSTLAVQNIPGTAPHPSSNGSTQTLSPNPNVSYPWGQVFTIANGTWGTENTPNTPITPDSFKYQWQRCDSNGLNCKVIVGATGQSYTTTADDVGGKIQAYIGATKSNVSSPLYLVGTTFTLIEKTPVNTDKPKVVGDPYTGQVLSSTAGGWDAHNPTYTRRWFRCEADGLGCNAILNETGTTYTTTANDLGKRIEIEITATQADPSQNRVATAFSDPTAVITDPPVVSTGGGTGGGGGGGGSGTPPDTAAPVLGAVKAASGKLTAKKPLKIAVTSSEAGVLRITLQRLLAGRKVARKCVRPTRKNRKKPTCTRRVTVNRRTVALKAGANTVAIRRKLGKKLLPLGRYRAVLVPVDAAGNKGRAKAVVFRVTRR